MREKLKNFNFVIDKDSDLNKIIKSGVVGKAVTIPHSWSVDAETYKHKGRAVYSTEFELKELKFTEINVGACFLKSEFYINGIKVKEHRSGYTQFDIDITEYVKVGSNSLVIVIDNSFMKDTLPYDKHFDWADDGGIIRDMYLSQYESGAIKNTRISYTVTKSDNDGNCDCTVSVDCDTVAGVTDTIKVTVTDLASKTIILESDKSVSNNRFKFDLSNVKFWEPNCPQLYLLTITDTQGSWEYESRFGIRTLSIGKAKVILNGKEIILRGMEYMPGSNSNYGMAEPNSELIKHLELLKGAGCNFTRFHWQQASEVYDWCDENGLMVQEEIPFWGCPKSPTKLQYEIAKEQADEMLNSHYNHPSIVCWGVGNELNGFSKRTANYVKEMVKYFKDRDNSRFVNYVSSTFGLESRNRMAKIRSLGTRGDASAYGDICMWNDYTGQWQRTDDCEQVIAFAKRESKNKPIVVSEFGLCEPFFKGGDKRRIEIYEYKIAMYKKYDFAGWIFFSLNDYRTHFGEATIGLSKYRIHGSVSDTGEIKPSYEVVKKLNTID